MKEDGSLGRDGVGNTSSGTAGIGAKDLDALDTLATQTLDGRGLLLDSGERGVVVGLDNDCRRISIGVLSSLGAVVLTFSLILEGILSHQ